MPNTIKTTIQSYNKTVKNYIKKVDKLHPKQEAKIFLSLIKPNSPILDLGCGYGRDAKIFSERGYKVVGIDLSEKMIETAKKISPKSEFKLMDIRKLSFTNNSFDGIWANASFLHIPKKEIKTALKEAYRVLKQNGTIYLSVKEGIGEGFIEDTRYGGIKKFFSFFQKDEIENFFNDARFSIVKSYVKKVDDNYSTHPWICVFGRKERDTIYLTAEGDEIKMSKASINAVEKSFGIWKNVKEDSVAYVRRIRKESEKRRKRLGL